MTDLLERWVPGEGFYFEHAARAICGAGVHRTIAIPAAGPDQVALAAARAREALARLGPEAIAVGALPFGGDAPATFVVPAVTFVRDAAGEHTITFGDGDAAPPERVTRHAQEPLRVTPVPDPAGYVAAVEKARARIHAGELDKVVLARMLVAQATHVFDRRALLARLRDAEPDAYVFAAQGFIGASPELLVSRHGDAVRARPLAGTAPRGATPIADEAAARALLASAKDRAEHALVADAVRAALGPVCASIASDPEPVAVPTSKVWHLATEVRGTLRDPSMSALDLAALLHPTPAVCGTPTDRARAAIAELEDIDRALYAGLVGWIDASGDGEFAVVLRCAEVAGRIALLFAGAGIVAASDPDAELAETDAKFRGMLEALGYA